jgi:hypothetical protein
VPLGSASSYAIGQLAMADACLPLAGLWKGVPVAP